ncbi:histidine--tRNA ligase [[Mycoplasma] gypis]|uniref:Histidine--tRNA ligase n=1 Tax=[Mycoplasma] gypis TaxID=92404 RepID=A0ABZ2RRG5_9BACT|nr:histidine--tRNA ligase [[Mycoplasma] gypis]MBN0919304.1 histidine--tRNA ligase [[Mycoplasma] gypis]
MYQKVKGTKDIYGKEAVIYQQITDSFRFLCNSYGFKYLETPIIEYSELFSRSSGEFSDIVKKEMYSFQTRGDKMISLRPEGTASAIRAIVENKLIQQPTDYLKVFYYGNMYRYERPQKGRYREFRQGGVEFLAPRSPETNFEIIKLASDFLKSIDIHDFVLEINSLGSNESRKKYTQHLKEYLSSYASQLSDINKQRLEQNVLRILDDKDQNDLDFIKNCPKLWDFLSEDEIKEFNSLLKYLQEYNIPYQVNKNLVRGLDYYNDVVFEFVSTSQALGSKSTILAGGRYDGMIKQLGGSEVDSIGFAFGAERLVEIKLFDLETQALKSKPSILICYLNDEEKAEMQTLAWNLRAISTMPVEIFYETLNIKKMFKKAQKLQTKVLIFKELNQQPNEIKIKILEDGQKVISEQNYTYTDYDQLLNKINQMIKSGE